ncbi:hypothetical protein [Chryseobacterium potabilaquae]|uniref:Uncharacterized protein n=1 Tax=Chryseobacterium potabilaquae TaxID=2675057 RepID=A0A6N4XEC1_9FLAO|nr:hypothetical protein [Chryseobacterium potabilaquae]CAA7197000.1 hypothetical protein CHRY9293_03058 [Chryseobacterium potabilaquae]
MNMKKYSICYLIVIGSMAYAQNTYVDVTTTAALMAYSDNLKKQQNKTVEEQTKLQQAQAWVASQMVVANSIQNKILKGLRETSGTLQNGIQVKQIYEDLAQCKKYSGDITHLVTIHPQFSIFGAQASEKAYEQILRVGVDVSDILASGELNLATAGDRYRLIFNISENVKKLKLWLLTIKLNIERAERLGFWNAINPFQGYINTDKDIVRSIMDKYKYNF